jgi:hypothetical protein
MTDLTDAPAGHRSSAGEPLVMPGAATAKLPLPSPPPGVGESALSPELMQAWTRYMINGFRQNERMFNDTLAAFMKPYRLTVWLYAVLFAVGVGLFVVAAIIGLRNGAPVVAIAFAGLSVAAFLAFFVREPLHALEENLEFITWLGVAFNTYWTRLLYMTDPQTVQADLKAADDDFRASVERLIKQHARLRGKRSDGAAPPPDAADAGG